MKPRLFSLKSLSKAGAHKRNDGDPSYLSETSHTLDMSSSLRSTARDLAHELPNGPESTFCGNGSITEIQPTFTPSAGTGTGTAQTNEPPIPHRRSSLKHTSSFSVGKAHRTASMPLISKMSVSFDETVSFVAVPRLSDVCAQHPESLFYNKEDFAVMTDWVLTDAEKIKKISKSKSSRKKLLDSDKKNEMCDLGIEHRTCTAKERFDREAKARAVILLVLREQKRQNRRYSSDDYNSAQVEMAIAKASMNATKEAVLRARERAAQLEGQCSSSRRGSSKQKRRTSWTAYF